VLGLRIGIGVHGDSFDAQALGSGRNSAGDIASVGNQDFLKQCALPPPDSLRTQRVPSNFQKHPLRGCFRHGLQ
jgi:hypothetical protein